MFNLKSFLIGTLFIGIVSAIGYVLFHFPNFISQNIFSILLGIFAIISFYVISCIIGYLISMILEDSEIGKIFKAISWYVGSVYCNFRGHPKYNVWFYTSPTVPAEQKHIGYCWSCKNNLYEGAVKFRHE